MCRVGPHDEPSRAPPHKGQLAEPDLGRMQRRDDGQRHVLHVRPARHEHGQVRRQQRREGASETVPGDVDLPFLDLGAAGCDDEFLRWVKVEMRVESADASIDVQH